MRRRKHLNVSRYLARWVLTVLLTILCIQLMKMAVHVTHQRCVKRKLKTTFEDGIDTKIQQQEKLEMSQRNLFNAIFGNIIKNMHSRHQIVLYSSDETHRDGAVSVDGLLSAFLFSVLSNRRFVINTTVECSSLCHYKERALLWNLTSLGHYVGTGIGIFYAPQTDEQPYQSKTFYSEILRDFEIRPWKNIVEDVLIIFGDFDIVDDILRHKDSFLSFPETLRSISRADLHRIVYQGLFETDPVIRVSIKNQFRKQIDNTEKLVCYHSYEDYPYADMVAMSLLKTYAEGYKFYMSDLGIKIDEFHKHSWKLVRINFKGFKERRNCPKSFDHVATEYILSLCHILVTTKDPVGIHAARMRSNSDGLYCCNDNGVIYPCTRESISESFRDESKLPTRIN